MLERSANVKHYVESLRLWTRPAYDKRDLSLSLLNVVLIYYHLTDGRRITMHASQNEYSMCLQFSAMQYFDDRHLQDM